MTRNMAMAIGMKNVEEFDRFSHSDGDDTFPREADRVLDCEQDRYPYWYIIVMHIH